MYGGDILFYTVKLFTKQYIKLICLNPINYSNHDTKSVDTATTTANSGPSSLSYQHTMNQQLWQYSINISSIHSIYIIILHEQLTV